MLYIHQSSIINHAKGPLAGQEVRLHDSLYTSTAIKTFLSSTPRQKSEIDPVLSYDPFIYHHLNLLASQKRNEPTKNSKPSIIYHAGELFWYKGTLALTFVLKSEQTIFIRDIIMVIRVNTAIRALILLRRDNTPYP
jgi:hypothetical protein